MSIQPWSSPSPLYDLIFCEQGSDGPATVVCSTSNLGASGALLVAAHGWRHPCALFCFY